MICCKIVMDVNFVQSNFKEILDGLGKFGDILWDNNYLYFANVDNPKITESNINKFMKKIKCSKFFVENFDDGSFLRESDFANTWIADKIIKITYNDFEINHQKEMRTMYDNLISVEKDIEQLLKQQKESVQQNVVTEGDKNS